jgi:hypothetical protein
VFPKKEIFFKKGNYQIRKVFPKKEFFQKIRTNQKKINKKFLFWKVFLKKENSKKGKKFPHSEK